jgi:hypothetical protein
MDGRLMPVLLLPLTTPTAPMAVDREVGAEYSVWLCSQTGVRVQEITQFIALDYARSTNAPGEFTLDMPHTFDISLLKEDSQLEIWRTPPDGAPTLETGTGWFVQSASRIIPADSAGVIRATGASAMHLLTRRVIPMSSKTKTKKKRKKGGANAGPNGAAAGDAILRLAREHLGRGLDYNYNGTVSGSGQEELNSGDRFNTGDTLTGRDLETPGYLTFAAYQGHGVVLKKKFGWREVWDSVVEMIEATDELLEPIAVDIEASSTNPLRYPLKTYAPIRGTDRTTTVTLSPDSPHYNLADVEWGTDWSEHVNQIWVKKPKKLASRPNAFSVGTNPYARREALVDASDAETNEETRIEGDAALREGKPKKVFTCRVVNTPISMYGRDWFWGDKVTVSVLGETATATVAGINVRVAAGEETITAVVEVDQGVEDEP